MGFGQSFADMLVGPQLKAIVIANGDEMSALTLLEKIRYIAGPLESIIMQFDTPSSTRIDETLASIISRSRRLRSLVLKNQTIPPRPIRACSCNDFITETFIQHRKRFEPG